jgi:hypothetical protein
MMPMPACEKLLDEMYEVGQRFLAVQDPGDAEAIEELVQAKANWEIIDQIREEHDPAPVDAISIVLARDPNLAMRMLYRCAPAHGYTLSRQPAFARGPAFRRRATSSN